MEGLFLAAKIDSAFCLSLIFPPSFSFFTFTELPGLLSILPVHLLSGYILCADNKESVGNARVRDMLCPSRPFAVCNRQEKMSVQSRSRSTQCSVHRRTALTRARNAADSKLQSLLSSIFPFLIPISILPTGLT